MSQSNRLKNEAIEQAREEGRLEVAPKQEPGASLANAPQLDQAFLDGKQAPEPLDRQAAVESRPTLSAAQQYDPIDALKDRPKVSPADKLNESVPKLQEKPETLDTSLAAEIARDLRAQENGLDGSEMVKNQAPSPSPTNSTPEGRAQDAKSFDEDWQAEQERAGLYNSDMKDLAAEVREDLLADQWQDHSQDQSQGQGY